METAILYTAMQNSAHKYISTVPGIPQLWTSPTMLEKADEQLDSAGAFFYFLISSAMYLHYQLFSFISY